MRIVMTACVAAASLALSAYAPAESPSPGSGVDTQPRQCFSVREIRSFGGGPDQVLVRLNGGDVYALETGAGCANLNLNLRISVAPEAGSARGSRLCTDDWAEIVAPDPMSGVCRAQISRKLTTQEIAALPPGDRP
jgi:hypothetical protein